MRSSTQILAYIRGGVMIFLKHNVLSLGCFKILSMIKRNGVKKGMSKRFKFFLRRTSFRNILILIHESKTLYFEIIVSG